MKYSNYKINLENGTDLLLFNMLTYTINVTELVICQRTNLTTEVTFTFSSISIAWELVWAYWNCPTKLVNVFNVSFSQKDPNDIKLHYFLNPWCVTEFPPLFQMSADKKEKIWLSPMTKAPTPTEMSKGQNDNTNNATKKFDYTAIADRLRMVSWSNYSHPAGVVKPVYGLPTFPQPQQPHDLVQWQIKYITRILRNWEEFRLLFIQFLSQIFKYFWPNTTTKRVHEIDLIFRPVCSFWSSLHW